MTEPCRMDDPDTKVVSVSDARRDLAELVNRVAYGGRRIILQRRGKPLAALVPIKDLELLEGSQDSPIVRS